MTTPAEPRSLILETSGRIGRVAVGLGDKVLATRRLDEARRHARDLTPAIAELLAAQTWQPRDLDAVIVSRGPGSYTGLRVGVMSAKTFAYATGCTLLAVDTFAAIALQAPAEALRVEVLSDAQKGRVYAQRFVQGPAEGPLEIVDFTTRFGVVSADTWVTGPGLGTYRAKLPEGWRIVAEEDWEPRPESLLQLALPRWRAGEKDDVYSLEPLYLRPSSAEEQWARRAT